MFGESFQWSFTRGTGSNDGNIVTMTSTGAANWSFTVNPNVNLKQIKTLLGHTIKFVFNYEWLNKPSGASMPVTPCLLQFNTGGGVRQAYFTMSASPNENGTIIKKYVLTRELFSTDSSKYNDDYYFVWRAYLNSNSGGKIRFSIEAYDLGVI